MNSQLPQQSPPLTLLLLPLLFLPLLLRKYLTLLFRAGALVFLLLQLTPSQAGGVISVYGMTVSPKMDFLMSAVLRNIEVRGSTMGSRKEFADMVSFVREKKLKPVVSRTVHGFDVEKIDGLFDDMKSYSQFGKLVITLGNNEAKSRL